MKKILLTLPLILFVLLGLLFWLQIDNKDKEKLPSPLINKPMPEFSLPDLLADKTLTKANIIGTPMLVNVWATWCPTCRAEHEFLNALKAQGIAIVGINYKDETPKALNWLAKLGNPYTHVVVDKKGMLGLDLGVYGAPETFLIDSKGIIRAKYVGDLNAKVWQTLKPTYEAMQ